MRRFLNGLYEGAAWLAAGFMVALLVAVLVAIASRQIGVDVPGINAYAGYFMAACGFLAMASTLRHGEHIRVTLVLSRLHGRSRRVLEGVTLAIGALLAGLFAWFSIKLLLDSYEFHDISTDNDATPLWIPQLGMAIGAVIFLIAFVDGFVQSLRGTAPDASPSEAPRSE